MKIKDVNHNHSLTDLLKIGIFSILMLAPMINVGVRSAYVICNKNAYQSYYGETINEKEYTQTNINDLKIGDYVYFIKDANQSTTVNIGSDNYIYVSILSWNNTTHEAINSPSYTDLEVNRMRIINGTNNLTYFEFSQTGENGYYIVRNSTGINVSFYYEGNNGSEYLSLFNNNFYKITTNKYSYLDNVFEYSVNNLTESPLYNWVENTAIYSGVTLMNTQLGITQPVISLLVVYWLLLTIIYVIIDIVIRVFTWLTHMIGSKTA